jgi:pyruvate/2-oxoglutarate dehydrogenase complex dihydrolipoamide dehydrogenase (E3) component
MAIEHFQNLIIGSGTAGNHLAWDLASLGQSTAVVERSLVGGACPNVACLPSKNVIYSAKAASLVHPSTGLGVVTGSLKIDMAGVARRKRAMVDELTQLQLGVFRSSNAELIMGEARFIEKKTVQVALNDGRFRQLHGERVFLCVGTRASIPDIPGLVIAGPMTHVEALDLERLPDHLVIIGGGYVGLEFAQAMRRFGSRVTIIQRGLRLLEHEDEEVSIAIQELMNDDGIEVLLQGELSSVTGRSGSTVQLKVRSAGTERSVEASDILVAAGRTPNTDQLDAARAGIELDPRGYIRVNQKLETSADGVWAMGDCAGSPQFTHVAHDDYRVVRSNLLGGKRTTDGRLIPYCLFTDPELAHIGMKESEAEAKGLKFRVAKVSMAFVPRMRAIGQLRGFMKALIGPDDRIMGFTVLGAEASELMSVVHTAMLGDMPYTALRDAIFAHPTATEGLSVLFSHGMSVAK